MKRFRNEEMQKLYQHYLVSGLAGYVKDLFESMGIKNPKEKADLRMRHQPDILWMKSRRKHLIRHFRIRRKRNFQDNYSKY